MKHLHTLNGNSFQSLPKKKRIILLIVLIIVVLLILAAVVFRSTFSGVVHRVTNSHVDDFPHNAQSNSLFIGLDNDLLVCTQSQVQLLSSTGDPHIKETVSMSSPALNTAEHYAVAYDVGGQQLRAISGEKIIYKLELPPEESIICATVNQKGWMAVTTKVGGYKAVVTVYDTDFNPVLSIRLSSRYVSDAIVTPDCRGVYLISPGQSGGTFENTLLYYTLSSKEKPAREVSLGGNVVLSMLSGSKCWILGDQSLFILDSSGVITASYSYKGQYLKMGSLGGSEYAVLYLSRSSAGGAGTLVTIDGNGQELGKLDVEGQALALTAKKHNIALLTTSDILYSDYQLTSYTKEPNQRGVRNMTLYDDGSAALINSASVSLYFPPAYGAISNEAAETGTPGEPQPGQQTQGKEQQGQQEGAPQNGGQETQSQDGTPQNGGQETQPQDGTAPKEEAKNQPEQQPEKQNQQNNTKQENPQ